MALKRLKFRDYWTFLASSRFDFSQLKTIHMSLQRLRRISQCCSRQRTESAITNQLSGYQRRRIPHLQAHSDTGENTLVKTWRTVERMMQSALNWKTLPDRAIQKYGQESRWMWIWKYAPFRSNENITFPFLINPRTEATTFILRAVIVV